MTWTLPNRYQFQALKLWHAAFSGAFLVAYVSDDVYAMHAFAGYLVLALTVVRLVVGYLAKPPSPLALTNPKTAFLDWLEKRQNGKKARNPLYAGLAALLLGSIFLAGASGWLADGFSVFEGLHEGLAEMTPAFIAAHVGFVLFKPVKKYLVSFMTGLNNPPIPQ